MNVICSIAVATMTVMSVDAIAEDLTIEKQSAVVFGGYLTESEEKLWPFFDDDAVSEIKPAQIRSVKRHLGYH